MTRTPARLLPAALGLLLGALLAGPASAGDVTVFLTIPSPTDQWDRGFGAALTTTWFHAVALEGEAARMPGDLGDSNMTTFTGSILLAPPLGPIVPYGGVGFGIFRQTIADESDTGVVRTFVLGLKLKLGLAVVKGDYRDINLSGEPFMTMDRRFSFGIGISF